MEKKEYSQDEKKMWEQMRCYCEYVYDQPDIPNGGTLNYWCQHSDVQTDDFPEDCKMEHCPALKYY